MFGLTVRLIYQLQNLTNLCLIIHSVLSCCQSDFLLTFPDLIYLSYRSSWAALLHGLPRPVWHPAHSLNWASPVTCSKKVLFTHVGREVV